MAGFLLKRRSSVFPAGRTLRAPALCLARKGRAGARNAAKKAARAFRFAGCYLGGVACLGILCLRSVSLGAAAEPASNTSARTKAAPDNAASADSVPGKVTAVRFWSLGDVTRVAVEVSSGFHFRSDRLSNPDRVFFDVVGARPDMARKGLYSVAVGDALVKRIRLAETQPGVTRVVLDLEQHAEFTASQLSNPDRLIIELRAKDQQSRPKDPSVPPVSTSVTGARTLVDPRLYAVRESFEERARTTEPRSGETLRVPANLEGLAGPVRASEEPARTTEPRSGETLRVPASLEGLAGPVRAPAPKLHPSGPQRMEAVKTETGKSEARRFEARKFEPPPSRERVVPAGRSVELPPPPPLTVASRPMRAPLLPTPLRRDLAPPPPPVQMAPVQMAMLTTPDLTATGPGNADPPKPDLAGPEKTAAKRDLAASVPSPAARESLPAKRNVNGDRSMARAFSCIVNSHSQWLMTQAVSQRRE